MLFRLLFLLAPLVACALADHEIVTSTASDSAVGGDVCPMRVCSEAEDKYNCSMWYRSGEKRPPCPRQRARPKQLYVEDEGTEPRHKCTVCGVSPEVHIFPKRSRPSVAQLAPPFPPRTRPTFCAVAGDDVGGEQWPRVSTAEESTLRRDQASQFLSRQARRCNCQVVGGGEPVNLLGRVFPVGITHVRGLCGPYGRRLDIALQTDQIAGGSNNLVVHGTATEATCHGRCPIRQEHTPRPLESGAAVLGFPVVARFAYQGGGVGSIEHDRAVPCAPAKNNGGQRCAALQEACISMLTAAWGGLTTTLELQGVPGWPQLYGLGCCEYRLNATHAAPLVVDARQPLQSLVMWDHYNNPQQRKVSEHRQKQLLKNASSVQTAVLPAEEALPALSACHDAKPPLSRKQCALRAALLSAELLHGLTEERMIGLQEHVDYGGDTRRRLHEVHEPPDGLGHHGQYLAFVADDRSGLDHERLQEAPAPGRSLKEALTPEKPNTPKAVLRGLGTRHAQFAFVPTTGQVAMADTDHLGHVMRTSNLRAPSSYRLLGTAHAPVRADFAACYSNSVLRPLLRLKEHDLAFIKQLVNEIEARHQLLKANAATLDATERGVVQISFSCIHAWLRAAAAEILPAETMTRATPFNRLQGGWGE